MLFRKLLSDGAPTGNPPKHAKINRLRTARFSLLMTKVGFISLGCPKNLVDSEVMMGMLARDGYELTPRADDAEILVVNTCSFIESAQKESIDTILEMAEHKKFGSAKKLIVAGCLVERFRDQILEQVPEVDAVVGTGEVERIIEAVEGDMRVLPAQPPSFLYHDLTPRILTTPKHQAYIKIAEGCDHPCTFCIIPQLRGAFRSRRFESVVREAENLAAAGTREITLIGQDTTSYGEDLGLRDGLAQLAGKAWRESKICCGCVFFTLIPIASRRKCWRRLRHIRTSRNISICRCSTPAAMFWRA